MTFYGECVGSTFALFFIVYRDKTELLVFLFHLVLVICQKIIKCEHDRAFEQLDR